MIHRINSVAPDLDDRVIKPNQARDAKNLVTKAMVAALLADSPSVLKDVPKISDVEVVEVEGEGCN